ncbi:MAG: TIGR03905 family TSCPD domain-containing protein [Oscillospiraceae bacterium]
MTIEYKPHGVCTRKMTIEVEDGIVKGVDFVGGCSGNTQGVGVLIEGMKVEDVISKLEGIKCGSRPTSCPAQLAQALQENLDKIK